MFKALRQRFGTIRWKLTSSYVAVTLLATLLLEAIFFLVAIWSLLNSVIVPKTVAQGCKVFALALRSEYEAADRRPEVLSAQLWELITPTDNPEQRNPLEYSIDVPKTLSAQDIAAARASGHPAAWQVPVIALLDTQGRVITATLQDVYRPGLRISDIEVKEATEVIYRALGTGASGGDDPAALIDAVNGQPLGAAPVLSRDGRLVGVIYARLPRPPFSNILRNIPRVLTYSFLPVLAMSAIVGLVFGLLAGRNLSGRLNRLTAASAGLARGDLTRRVVDCSVDEVGQLGRQFNAMADQLGENLRSLRRLAEQNAQLAEQATQLATVEERNRLARDLHDSVSQELFSLTMLAAASQRQLERNPQLVAAQLSEIQEMATRALHETRSLIFALRPAMLDGRGLGPALHELVEAMQDRQGLQVKLAISGERRLPLEHEQALFRIVQEALANVVRHSGVRAACIDLRYENNYTYLEINDKGRGFDALRPRNPRSLGLDSMAERASALRGTFTVDSRPTKGTIIAVTLPVG